MAEKRRPGFNIPLNFYDGPEVGSIPKRIRAAAVGVWALAGNYAATQLSDGYVGAGLLRTFGCTDAIRAALKVTINKKGELSPLWIDARNGGVQLTNWPKHQRTNDEVTAYRANEAERKREERAAKHPRTNDGNTAYLTRTNDEVTARETNKSDEHTGKRNSPTSENAETSGRTTVGQRPDVRSDAGDPKTETETETKTEIFGYVQSAPYESDATRERGDNLSAPVTVGATRLVERMIPLGAVNDSTRAGLRIEASQLINSGETESDVGDCLRLWLTKPDLGVKALKSLMAEVYKSRAAIGVNGTRLSTSDRRVAEVQALKTAGPHRLEIE